MFNRKKKVQKAFKEIRTYIDDSRLSDEDKVNLKGLLLNVKIRAGAV